MIPRRMSLNVTHLPSLTSALYIEWARFIKMGVVRKSGRGHANFFFPSAASVHDG